EFLRLEQGHRWLGMRQSDISNWTRAAGLTLTDQLDFAPPDTLKQGLSVKIWVADKAQSKDEIRP
ncbi:MAG: ArsR family transcriptional regulator, partial [Henriciella sp.]